MVDATGAEATTVHSLDSGKDQAMELMEESKLVRMQQSLYLALDSSFVVAQQPTILLRTGETSKGYDV
eukprot:8851022-Karenia_brevis.AAC.1